MKKPPTKIVLVKNKVQVTSPESSGDEQSQPKSQPRLWKQNNHRWLQKTDMRHKQNQTLQDKQERADNRQVRKLLLTDKKSQVSLFQFYKSNWEIEKLLKKEFASKLIFIVMFVAEDCVGSNTKEITNLSSIHQCSFPP